jgi:hypothetical protein
VELYRIQGLEVFIIVMIWPHELGFEDSLRVQIKCGQRYGRQTLSALVLRDAPRSPKHPSSLSEIHVELIRKSVASSPDGILASHSIPLRGSLPTVVLLSTCWQAAPATQRHPSPKQKPPRVWPFRSRRTIPAMRFKRPIRTPSMRWVPPQGMWVRDSIRDEILKSLSRAARLPSDSDFNQACASEGETRENT